MQKIKIIMLFTCVFLLLTSCAEVEYRIEIDEDGSANIAYLLEIDKNDYEEYKDKYYTTIKVIKESLQQNGFYVDEFIEDDKMNFEAKIYMENIELIDEYDTLFLASKEGAPTIKHEKSFLSDKYTIDAKIDLTTYSESAADLKRDEMISEQLPIKLKIKSPINNKKSNADEIYDGELVWNLRYGEEKFINAQFEKSNYMVMVLICVILFAVVQFVTYKIVKKIMSRQNGEK